MTAPLVRLLALRCPACGNDLPAAENDVALVCEACLKACEVRNGTLVNVPFSYAAPKAERAADARLFYLPFWWYKVSLKLSCADPEFAGAIERFNAMKNIYVAAFAMRGVQLYGDPALAFTQQRVEAVEDENAQGKILGASRTCAEARKWTAFTVLSMVDRSVDVGKVKMSLRHEEERLLAVPFYDEGTHLRDGLLGERYAKHAFLDWNAISSTQK